MRMSGVGACWLSGEGKAVQPILNLALKKFVVGSMVPEVPANGYKSRPIANKAGHSFSHFSSAMQLVTDRGAVESNRCWRDWH
jgi:hypothetical protein